MKHAAIKKRNLCKSLTYDCEAGSIRKLNDFKYCLFGKPGTPLGCYYLCHGKCDNDCAKKVADKQEEK